MRYSTKKLPFEVKQESLSFYEQSVLGALTTIADQLTYITALIATQHPDPVLKRHGEILLGNEHKIMQAHLKEQASQPQEEVDGN